MKVYLDNNIVCGRVRADLEAPELAAVRQIEHRWTNGELEVVTSRESWREQDRTKDKNLRSRFEEDRPNVPIVPHDHRLLGIRAQFGGGWFANCPILTKVVDDALLVDLKAAGLTDDADARHLMYAVHNGCDRFVTTDPHFLDRRPALEKSCRGLRVVKPSELATELP
jgi:predicted nucleic acid-binding protein